MTVEQMRAIKKEHGLSYDMISNETGIPYSTVSKVMMGVTKSPRRETVRRLTAYFQRLQEQETAREDSERADAASKAGRAPAEREESAGSSGHEPASPGGRVTIEQRDSLPDDRRTELIDGVLYDMASPSPEHQDVIWQISQQIYECIEKSGAVCHMFIAPLDVVLSETEPTVVQPDLIVVCERSRFRSGKYYGAPKFVIEVLSPSTRRKDITLKLQKYTDAGVSEYWMVDPVRKKVIVCDLETMRDEGRDADIEYLYGFDGKVPVLCSEGKCSVDFDVIRRKMEEYFG